MAIKAGQIIHDANGFVVDRIQTGGVSNLNIPLERIYEVGNYQTVATIRDIPDLSFEVQSLDVSTEIEAITLGLDPTGVADHQALDFNSSCPMDVISPFRAFGAFNIVKGVVIPYLTLEQVQYRFGVKANAEETFTYRGDSVYYIPGTPKRSRTLLVDNTLTYTYGGGNPALTYTESGDALYVLSACVKNPTTGTYRRLFFGTDYTNTTTTITLLQDWFDSGYTHLDVCWGTSTTANYLQSVSEDSSVKPAAVRGKDIDVYVQTNAATPTMIRWPGVQSVDVQRRVNLEAIEEFGNYHYVSQDYDTADVTGSVTVKPVDDTELFRLLRQISNVSSTTDVIGPFTSTGLDLEIRIYNPDTGVQIKTLFVTDARFTVPNLRGQVQQKLQVQFNFESDGGNLVVYKGSRV